MLLQLTQHRVYIKSFSRELLRAISRARFDFDKPSMSRNELFVAAYKARGNKIAKK